VGWRQLAVEVYGGALVNSWLDRDLGLSGRVALPDGSVRLLLVDRPLARVPQLAIHLDREVNERGLLLDKQAHLTPVWGLGPSTEGDLVAFVAAELGVEPADVAAFDLMFHDLTPPTRLGADGDFIAAARLDNQFSCWAGIEALAGATEDGPVIPVVCLFDHEEVGSASTTGAAGPLLEIVIDRLVQSRGGTAEDRHRALAGSICVSADMAHAVHPNYPERHEPGHRPLPNRGPVLKVNANQRYATDATTEVAFTRACEQADVPWQVFVSRNNMPCGSTIGPLTATRLGMATVDIGCAQLSMHSARELAGARDPAYLAAALGAFVMPDTASRL
jgi:aspartyl aminopeptidase